MQFAPLSKKTRASSILRTASRDATLDQRARLRAGAVYYVGRTEWRALRESPFRRHVGKSCAVLTADSGPAGARLSVTMLMMPLQEFTRGLISLDPGRPHGARASILSSSTWPSARFSVAAPRHGRRKTNGFCERFHRALKEEFFTVAFRRTLCESLDHSKRTGSLPGVLHSGASPSRIPEPKDENPTRRSWKV